MFRRLIEYIKEALRKMVAYKDISDTIDISTTVISDEMADALDLWRKMYKDNSPWLDEDAGVYSLGLAQTICNEFSTLVLDEVKSEIIVPGVDKIDGEGNPIEVDTKTRAYFMNELYQKGIIDKLPQQLEKGMALGGLIIKPYTTADDKLAFDFIRQGDFYPIAFDDEGDVITDIAFPDQFISGDKIYTKIERQTFIDGSVVVENKAFVADLVDRDDDKEQELGNEIPLNSVQKWAGIEPQVKIDDVEAPLYGYYKVPLSNTVDLDSPLGISIFGTASKLIQRADEQFSRLDWEYEAGEIAIDVDPNALNYTTGYFGNRIDVDSKKQRIYRQIDLGQDDTYKAFTPTLRDANYQSGLTKYLMRIEDKVGLARGSLSEVSSEAKTATEIRATKQKTFTTVQKNQKALETALKQVVYAMQVYIDLYELAKPGEYELTTEWNDSVLTDMQTELTEKMTLQQGGILSKPEVRSWYTGEDIETSKLRIQEMEEQAQSKMLNDIYSNVEQPTLETVEE